MSSKLPKWLYHFTFSLAMNETLFAPLSYQAKTVKCLPTMQETWVQSLGQEDLLEKEMSTHSSILARKIPWVIEPGRLQSMGLQRFGHDWATSLSFYILICPAFLPTFGDVGFFILAMILSVKWYHIMI